MSVPVVLLVDDERDFRDEREHIVARTSAYALDILSALRSTGQPVSELWLDHDLGGDDTTMRIVDMLSEAAAFGDPYPVSNIYVHSMNNVGNQQILRSLRNYGYAAQHVKAIDWLTVKD